MRTAYGVQPGEGAMTDDLELLRRHEPIVRYHPGRELPPDGRRRPRRARRAHGPARGRRACVQVIPAGELTLERLAAPIAEAPMGRLFLSVATSCRRPMASRSRSRTAAKFRRGPGRLTQRRLLSRLVDAFFSLGLLLRGRVPERWPRRDPALSSDRRRRDDAPVLRTRPSRGRLDRAPVLVLLLRSTTGAAATTARTTTNPTGR